MQHVDIETMFNRELSSQRSPLPQHFGHLWAGRDAVQPRLLSVLKSVCRAGYTGGGKCSTWLLNYSYTPFGRFSVGSTKHHWFERGAYEAHLFSPQTFCQEDTTLVGVAYTTSSVILFTGGELTALSNCLHGGTFARYYDPFHRLGELIDELHGIALYKREAGFWEAQSVFYRILALLQEQHAPEGHGYVIPQMTADAISSAFVQSVHTYLREHITEHINRMDLANSLHISVSALSHQYRKETAESPMTTLTRMRLGLAKSLLMKGDSLKTIAMQTGFYDAFHLSKMFKKYEGVSTREFLRQVKENQ